MICSHVMATDELGKEQSWAMVNSHVSSAPGTGAGVSRGSTKLIGAGLGSSEKLGLVVTSLGAELGASEKLGLLVPSLGAALGASEKLGLPVGVLVSPPAVNSRVSVPKQSFPATDVSPVAKATKV